MTVAHCRQRRALRRLKRHTHSPSRILLLLLFTSLLPAAAAGKQVYVTHCAACHAISPDTVIVGPSLAGIATRAGERVPGQDAATYLLISVLRPDEFLVAGFENLMPTTLGKTLTGAELDAVIAYLLTLP